ncbi:hypothetical protein WJX79_000621 [Trebouxia sp. C0005]
MLAQKLCCRAPSPLQAFKHAVPAQQGGERSGLSAQALSGRTKSKRLAKRLGRVEHSSILRGVSPPSAVPAVKP